MRPSCEIVNNSSFSCPDECIEQSQSLGVSEPNAELNGEGTVTQNLEGSSEVTNRASPVKSQVVRCSMPCFVV